MNYILTFLAAVIGVLVVVLRIQGGKLHEAQIKLLLTAIDRTQGEKDQAVKAARDKLSTALSDYYKAKKGQ